MQLQALQNQAEAGPIKYLFGITGIQISQFVEVDIHVDGQLPSLLNLFFSSVVRKDVTENREDVTFLRILCLYRNPSTIQPVEMKIPTYSSGSSVMNTTAPDQLAYVPHRFSVDAYFRMADSGILTESDRVELIDGQILVMEPPGPEHASRVSKVAYVFNRLLVERRVLIRTENPTLLGRFDAPQPDIAIVRWRDDFYVSAHPCSSDIHLAVEVAWSSAPGDRRVKSPLYARSGIGEFWLVDLQNARVDVYREPSRSGYQFLSILESDSTLCPLAFPDVEVKVSDLLL